METWMIFVFGFILGIKHAMEPDHVIAVSAIVSRTRKFIHSLVVAVSWGIGHTLTLLIVGIMFIAMKQQIRPEWSSFFEMAVGIVLIYLGFAAFFHPHGAHHKQAKQQSEAPSRNIRSLVLGALHGLAGSASMIVLTMTTIKYQWQAGFYILIFGFGTIIGMCLCTLIIAAPFVVGIKRGKGNLLLTRATGVISVLFGIHYCYENFRHLL